MPELKLVYIAGFNVEKNTGRNKATREKAATLQRLLPKGAFSFIYPGSSRFRFMAYLKVLLFDIQVLVRLFFVEKNVRVIQRTTFLPVTNIYLKIRGVAVFYELHTDMRDEIRHYTVGRLEKLVLHGYVFFERLNLKLASGIIYNHPVLQKIISVRYKKPSIHTYNGANVHDLVPMDTTQCRLSLGWDEQLRYYVFIGSVSRWRGVEQLVEIFNHHMTNDDVLVIVGNASHDYGREIVRKASGNARIIFKSEVEVQQVSRYINAADVCLVPVRPILTSPGNPLKLYDYIACGKPVIGQEGVIGCADEILKYDVGIVTDFFDASRAAAEMHEFVLRCDTGRYRKHNRRVAIEDVSWETRMKDWLEFILR
jgi:glycosyltransferase involved in cell wall biosynthesis